LSDVVLVTGGAGFIGSHLVDRLVDGGADVRVLDAIEPQVHGDGTGFRNPAAGYVEGSVTDRNLLDSTLEGVGSVVHLAAQVGVGQSMYEMNRYVRDNCVGTSTLLEALSERREQVRSLVVASSMSIYGEGYYDCPDCGGEAEVSRPLEALKARRWEPVCARCAGPVHPRPTPQSKRLDPGSVYATTKRDQEELCLVVGRAYGIRTIALRFFNVYGPRQSLSNPYTGVAAIFLSRLLNGAAPLIFEDGGQSRDFTHVSDIVQAIELSLASGDVGDVALNVGTGISTSVREVADVLAAHLGTEIQPEIVNEFRQGDIRHCFGDISRIRESLGYEPKVAFADGMAELIEWTRGEGAAATDLVARAEGELRGRGLVV
jgi:dTDP-L-rhamnose 4-epimerase